jgi:hypothetical protein
LLSLGCDSSEISSELVAQRIDICSHNRAAALREAVAAQGPYVLDVVTQRDCATPVNPYNTMAAEYAHAHYN